MSAVLRERYVSPLRSIYFISVEVAGYAIRHLLHMTAGDWGRMACTLLAHQSSTQTLALMESIPSCSNRLWKTFPTCRTSPARTP